MRTLLACAMAGMTMVTYAADVCEPVDLAKVKVGGELGRRLNATVENNLLVIDLDKDFLAPFLERKATDGYVGIGKTLDAFARFAAYTGDERVIARKKHIVDTLLASQEPDGYIGMMEPGSRVTKLWDVHEMSYLVLGLTSDYRFCGEERSLDGARRLADYLIARLSADPAPAVGPGDLSAVMGTTGLDPAFLALSDACGDAKYRDFTIQQRRLPQWNMPIVLGRWGKVEGHAYAYLAECLAQARLYRLTPHPSLLQPSREVLEFLLDGDGLVVTGTCGDHECWHDTQAGTTNLGETCATAYLMRWWDELFRQTGDPQYGDLVERAMYNALFAAQSPDGRHIRYYTPFEAGRVYYPHDSYCCPCNFRRIMAELPQMIVYRQGNGLFVNLYTTSTVQAKLESGMDVTLKQETDYPNSGKVKLTVEPTSAAKFPIHFRVPRWAKGHSIRVNGGELIGAAQPGEAIATVEQEWKPGDVVEIEFPMEWRLIKGRRTQEGRAALMRGPQIFAYDPARNPDMKDLEPRLMTINPERVEGPFPDDSVRPGGMACRVKMWEPEVFYPHAPTKDVVLTEYADPDATWTYFHLPNPNDERPVDDELLGQMPKLPDRRAR